jgi:hypothetical protein
MKKTVILANLIKVKNDLELYIKVDQMKRLKKLFDPTFDIKDINSKIETKEDQLIIIKEAIQEANTNNKDKDGRSLNYTIYLLSKYNRFKSDLLGLQRKLETDEFLSEHETAKQSLLDEIKELDKMIEKETDKKVKAEHLSAKNKLKRSLSKTSLKNNKSHTDKLSKLIVEDLKKVEEKITQTKDKLTKYNGQIKVEVDVSDEFEIVVK